MKSLEERVRDEIGVGYNPLYVAEILKKTDAELLKWLQSQCDNNKGTLQESLCYVGFEKRRTLDLGTKILEGSLKCMLFILKEFQARNSAITEATLG